MSLQDTRSVANHTSRGTRLHLPQIRETRKRPTPLPVQVRMLDGRYVSAMYFDSMCESARASLDGKARGCTEMLESVTPAKEWKAIRKWMKHQRDRFASMDAPPVPEDTLIAVLIAHTASFRRVSPLLVYDELVRDQTMNTLFRS